MSYRWLFLLFLIPCSSCVPSQESEVLLYRSILQERVALLPDPHPGASLTLVEALSMANQHNEQLAIRGEEYVQAYIIAHRSALNFAPTLSLQPSFTLQERPQGRAAVIPPQTGGNLNGGGTINVASPNLGFRSSGDTLYRREIPAISSFNVFRGFSDLNTLRAAEATKEQQRELLLETQASVLLAVAQTYYQILRSENLIEVLQQSLQLQKERLKEVESRLQYGLATALERAQSEAEKDATQVTLTQAESDKRNARTTLAALLGRESIDYSLQEFFPFPETLPEKSTFLSATKESRSDILAANAAIEAAKRAVQASLGQYYPSITLNLTGFLYREYYSDASKWNSLLVANLPLFSAGQIEAEVRTAWSRLRQAILASSLAERNILREVHIAYENTTTAVKKTKELQTQVRASEEAYTQSVSAYRNGLGINLEVLQAQERLLQAKLQLTNAKYDQAIFFFDLLRAVGMFPQKVML